MRIVTILNRALGATVATALVAGSPGFAAPPRHRVPAARRATARVAELPPGSQRPSSEVLLSVGQGELVTLPAAASDVWVSNPGVADVYVSNPRQIHLFGKGDGEATVFATSASGQVIYATNVRVAQNITSIDRMVKAAMPDADIHIMSTGQVAVITGTVANPADVAEAQKLVSALLNPGIDTSSPTALLKVNVVNRLKTATPLQVNLQVRIAEVSRSFIKNIGVNLATGDSTSGFKFGIGQGRTIGPQYTPNGPLGVGVTTGSTGTTIVTTPTTGSVLAGAGHLLGLDILGALDLGETDGQVTTLAQPNVTALSGETASFLAGGEIPIPISQGLGAVSVEYKQYGVSLAYTPTVLADGRISLRVRPEVSQLSSAGAVTISGVTIPALTTRRVETTAELGSGESLVIGGLLQNDQQNQITKAPGIGDLPVVGALFRSNGFKRNETELVIVITPYLVKPVTANQVVLPTDGYKAPTDLGRVFLGQLGGGTTGERRPVPMMVAPSAQPSLGVAATPSPARPVLPASPEPRDRPKTSPRTQPSVAPGFGLN